MGTTWHTLEIQMNDEKLVPIIYVHHYRRGTRTYEFPTQSTVKRIQKLIDTTNNPAFVDIKNGTVSYEFPKEE